MAVDQITVRIKGRVALNMSLDDPDSGRDGGEYSTRSNKRHDWPVID